MKSFREFLQETSFADLHPKTGTWEKIPVPVLQRAQQQPPVNIDTELFNLLSTAYAYVGGHVDFKKPSDIPANHTIWYAIDVNGDDVPDAVKAAKNTPHGIKWTVGAADATPEAKQAYIQGTVDALRKPGNYCEMSDAIMHIMVTRYHIPCVQTQAQVERVLGKPVTWIGEHPFGKYPGYHGFYERELGGIKHMKILLGHPR
jgi:hypothetical protein